MQIEKIEYLVALTQIVITDTLARLNVISENLPEAEAKRIYGSKNIENWRRNNRIVAYSTGNKVRNTICFLRSECEKARLTIHGSTEPDKDNRINQIVHFIHEQIKS